MYSIDIILYNSDIKLSKGNIIIIPNVQRKRIQSLQWVVNWSQIIQETRINC